MRCSLGHKPDIWAVCTTNSSAALGKRRAVFLFFKKQFLDIKRRVQKEQKKSKHPAGAVTSVLCLFLSYTTILDNPLPLRGPWPATGNGG
jgi:hypothetical protein